MSRKALDPGALTRSEDGVEPVIKVWVTKPDERARDSHQLANGQARFRDEPFQVGEVALMEPRDPDGPPAETFNCRCRKEEYLLSRLPTQYLPQIVGRLTPAQEKFLNRGTRIASTDEPGFVERLKERAGEENFKELLAFDQRLTTSPLLQELTLFAAQNHYFIGSGKPLNVSIEDPTKGLVISRNEDVYTSIQSFRGKAGTFPLSVVKFVMNTNLVHGNVTFRFDGTIDVTPHGWSLNGNLGAYFDRHDFDPGDRPFLIEIAVGLFRETVGRGGKPYEIRFRGKKKISETGTW